MRFGRILILVLLGTFISQVQGEEAQVGQYVVLFELPIDHMKMVDSRPNNPDIYRVNVFTPEHNQIAPVTIKKFVNPQDASRENMERTVRDILIDCGAAAHSIVIQEYGIDQCYAIKGSGNDNMGKNWVAAYFWMDRFWDLSRKWMGWTSCAIVSDYPNSEDLLASIHILNQTA